MGNKSRLRAFDRPEYSLSTHALRVWHATQGKPARDMSKHELVCRMASVAAVCDLLPGEVEIVRDVFSQSARYVSTSQAIKNTAKRFDVSIDHVAGIVRGVLKRVTAEMDAV